MMEPLTQAQAVARLAVLQAQYLRELEAVFAQCPDPQAAAIAQALACVDDGIFTPEQFVRSVRHVLGLGCPVLPSARELGQLSHAVYLGQLPGAASAPAVGG